MRAVLVDITDAELADRRSKGLDIRDEMWAGVLHMVPAPYLEHQRILDDLISFLRGPFKRSGRGTVVSGINVFRSSNDYRIPDLTVVAGGREHVFREDGVREGGPDAVIQIRSPSDETYEKLPFYAAIGTREVIIVDRDTKRPEIYRLAGTQYVALQPDADGWLLSETMTIRFRVIADQLPRLRVEDPSDPSNYTEI
jgi:putative restriction endonuclease